MATRQGRPNDHKRCSPIGISPDLTNPVPGRLVERIRLHGHRRKSGPTQKVAGLRRPHPKVESNQVLLIRCGASFKIERFLSLELRSVEVSIRTVSLNQLVMSTPFDNSTLGDDENLVCFPHRRESVSDH